MVRAAPESIQLSHGLAAVREGAGRVAGWVPDSFAGGVKGIYVHSLKEYLILGNGAPKDTPHTSRNLDRHYFRRFGVSGNLHGRSFGHGPAVVSAARQKETPATRVEYSACNCYWLRRRLISCSISGRVKVSCAD